MKKKHKFTKGQITKLNDLLGLPRKFEDYTYEDAIRLGHMCLALGPREAVLHFNLSCFYSAAKKVDKSLFYLEQALKRGFRDKRRIVFERLLLHARLTTKFWDLINQYFSSDEDEDEATPFYPQL